MQTLRTPDDRFVDLPDFAFEPHYAEIPDQDGGTLRVHYLDEGDPAAAPILLLHGEPSWSYLIDLIGNDWPVTAIDEDTASSTVTVGSSHRTGPAPARRSLSGSSGVAQKRQKKRSPLP